MERGLKNSQELFDQLMSIRNSCLDECLQIIRSEYQIYQNEDLLQQRVRVGTVFDAILKYLKTERVEELNNYFANFTLQIIKAGGNFDYIRILMDVLERITKNALRMRLTNPGGVLALHFYSTAFQLARMTALNVALEAKRNKLTSSDSPKPIALKPVAPIESTLNSNQPIFKAPKKVVAYLLYPLTPVPNSKPTLYKGKTVEGEAIEVVLVKLPQAYNQLTNDGTAIVCQIKQVGPLTLAYPLDKE